MTPAEYKELIKKDTIKIGQDVEMTKEWRAEETQELIDELVDDGNDLEVLEDFIKDHGESNFNDYIEEYLQAIDEHGKSNFVDYIEEYLQLVDQYGEEVVESFLEIFNIEDIGGLSDSYQGQYDSGAEFAQSIVNDCYTMDMPSWVEVDWKATWDNLDYDYTEGSGGHIFSQNF